MANKAGDSDDEEVPGDGVKLLDRWNERGDRRSAVLWLALRTTSFNGEEVTNIGVCTDPLLLGNAEYEALFFGPHDLLTMTVPEEFVDDKERSDSFFSKPALAKCWREVSLLARAAAPLLGTRDSLLQ